MRHLIKGKNISLRQNLANKRLEYKNVSNSIIKPNSQIKNNCIILIINILYNKRVK